MTRISEHIKIRKSKEGMKKRRDSLMLERFGYLGPFHCRKLDSPALLLGLVLTLDTVRLGPSLPQLGFLRDF